MVVCGSPCLGGWRRFLYGWLLSLSLAGDRTVLLTGPIFLHLPGLHFNSCVLRVRHDGSHGLLCELPWRRTIEAALNKSDVGTGIQALRIRHFVLCEESQRIARAFWFMLQHRPLAGPPSCCCRPRRRHGLHHHKAGYKVRKLVNCPCIWDSSGVAESLPRGGYVCRILRSISSR